MKPLTLLLAVLLTGCTAIPKKPVNTLTAAEMRAQYIGTIRQLEPGHVSMEPWLTDRDRYMIVGKPYADLRAGDPVQYKSRYRLPTIHRLRERDRWGNWTVKGDNNAVEDPDRVTPENYVGLVVKIN